jgi:hypothetical protein
VNYEDRTDLLPPAAVIAPDVLERLRSVDNDFVGSLDKVDEHPLTDAVARDVIAIFIASEGASGAPESALRVEQDAAECGYAFGRLLGGFFQGGSMTAEQVAVELNRMNLYALVDLIDESAPLFGAHLSAHLAERARRFPEAVALTGVLEEATFLSWCTGFGAALLVAAQ